MLYNSSQPDLYPESYSNKYFYNANKNINDILQDKKRRIQLSKVGFSFQDITLKQAIAKEKIQNKNRDLWNFAPNYNGRDFDIFGYKDKKVIVSTFGKNLKKIKFKNGALYIYNKPFKVTKQYFTVYVFVDDSRKIVETKYYLN